MNRERLTLWQELDELEKLRLEQAIAACDGNFTRAAEWLGISRRMVLYLREKHGMKPLPAARAAKATAADPRQITIDEVTHGKP